MTFSTSSSVCEVFLSGDIRQSFEQIDESYSLVSHWSLWRHGERQAEFLELGSLSCTPGT